MFLKWGAIEETGSLSGCRSSALAVVFEALCRLALYGMDRSNGLRPNRAGRLQQRWLGICHRCFNLPQVEWV